MTKQYNSKQVNDLIAKFPKHSELDKATADLLNEFPDFKSSDFNTWSDELIPHLVFADFIRFLKEKQNQDNSGLMKRGAEFISNLYDSDKHELKDLVLSSIFENLANSSLAKDLVPLLSAQASEEFRKHFN